MDKDELNEILSYVEILKDKNSGEFYFDNPSAAVDDIEWMLAVIEKLSKLTVVR